MSEEQAGRGANWLPVVILALIGAVGYGVYLNRAAPEADVAAPALPAPTGAVVQSDLKEAELAETAPAEPEAPQQQVVAAVEPEAEPEVAPEPEPFPGRSDASKSEAVGADPAPALPGDFEESVDAPAANSRDRLLKDSDSDDAEPRRQLGAKKKKKLNVKLLQLPERQESLLDNGSKLQPRSKTKYE